MGIVSPALLDPDSPSTNPSVHGCQEDLALGLPMLFLHRFGGHVLTIPPSTTVRTQFSDLQLMSLPSLVNVGDCLPFHS